MLLGYDRVSLPYYLKKQDDKQLPPCGIQSRAELISPSLALLPLRERGLSDMPRNQRSLAKKRGPKAKRPVPVVIVLSFLQGETYPKLKFSEGVLLVVGKHAIHLQHEQQLVGVLDNSADEFLISATCHHARRRLDL